MSKTLAQVVGIEKHLRKRDNEVGADLKKRIQVDNLVTGYSKVFKKKDEEIPPEYFGHDEYKEVALTVEDALTEAGSYSAAALNMIASKDKTNQTANADVEFRGEILLRDVSISHLLFLEDYLTEWRAFLVVLPVLDPVRRWTEDSDRRGQYRSAIEVRDRTVPEKVPVVLYPHTDKHQAQVQLVDKRLFVGTFEDQILSGAIPRDRKKRLLDNCDELLAAVKDAIAVANKTQAIEETAEGPALMAALLA